MGSANLTAINYAYMPADAVLDPLRRAAVA